LLQRVSLAGVPTEASAGTPGQPIIVDDEDVEELGGTSQEEEDTEEPSEEEDAGLEAEAGEGNMLLDERPNVMGLWLER
jgi:hypothetical protein